MLEEPETAAAAAGRGPRAGGPTGMRSTATGSRNPANGASTRRQGQHAPGTGRDRRLTPDSGAAPDAADATPRSKADRASRRAARRAQRRLAGRASLQAGSTRSAGSAGISARHRGRLAFVVDDERVNRSLTAALLRRWGLTVHEFPDGAQAVAALTAALDAAAAAEAAAGTGVETAHRGGSAEEDGAAVVDVTATTAAPTLAAASLLGSVAGPSGAVVSPALRGRVDAAGGVWLAPSDVGSPLAARGGKAVDAAAAAGAADAAAEAEGAAGDVIGQSAQSRRASDPGLTSGSFGRRLVDPSPRAGRLEVPSAEPGTDSPASRVTGAPSSGGLGAAAFAASVSTGNDDSSAGTTPRQALLQRHAGLGATGRQGLSAASGGSASGVGRARSALPGIPAVMTLDVQMPVLDGFGVLRAMRAMDWAAVGARAPAVVVVTGNARRHDRSQLDALGARAVLTKPLDPTRLAKELNASLSR